MEHNDKKPSVVVGLSGGVDSSVAAYLLKQQGYHVMGMFMRNWHDTTGTLDGDCPWEDDRMFAELVAKKLDIEFHYIDLSEEYRTKVIDYMFAEYEKGRTPNPDVLCNREIKFAAFADAAFKLGADYVATGHYCQVQQHSNGEFELIAGKDKNKDQSYFLCQVNQKQLSKTLFPIGHLDKPEVREIALREGLATAKRKDSQGICFVGKVDLPIFLQQKLKAKQGDIIEIPSDWDGYNNHDNIFEPYKYNKTDGVKIGEHNGAHFYTVGQRKGLGVGGKAEPLFVIGIDTVENVVYVGMSDKHNGLYRKGLFTQTEEWHWIRPSAQIGVGESKQYDTRIRYRQPLQKATLEVKENGYYITFDVAQKGAAPGQFMAIYEGEELVGSGVIHI